MVPLLPRLGGDVASDKKPDRATKTAAPIIVLDGQGVIDRPKLVRIADRAPQDLRLGEVSAEVGVPFELTGAGLRRLEDDVCNLARKTCDAEACCIHDLDPVYCRCRSPLQLIDCAA